MKKIKLIVDIPKKTLTIDKKLIKLENTFTNAYLDYEDSKEQVLNLKYEGRFTKNNSPIETELDKLKEAYGEKLFEKLNVSGNMLKDAHYISFYGQSESVIEKN